MHVSGAMIDECLYLICQVILNIGKLWYSEGNQPLSLCPSQVPYGLPSALRPTLYGAVMPMNRSNTELTTSNHVRVIDVRPCFSYVVVCDVMPCTLVDREGRFGGIYFFHARNRRLHRSENGDSWFFRNVCTLVQEYTASSPRRS